jgi:hypothetical protein
MVRQNLTNARSAPSPYRPPTRSIRVRWALQELGVDFEPITVNLVAGEHRRPAFLKLNPAGKVPVLVDGDLVLTESVAIVLYLADKYPSKGLIPKDLKQRADANRWLLFTATELEQPLWRIARHTALYLEHLRLPGEVSLARRDFIEMAAVQADVRTPECGTTHCCGSRQHQALSGALSRGACRQEHVLHISIPDPAERSASRAKASVRAV